jgi:PmbA protein
MHGVPIMDKNLKLLNLDQCIDETLEHASNWLDAKPVPTGKYDVIFYMDALSELLEVFSNCFSAKEAIEKTNPWENKLNQEVAATNFTLIDSPLYNDALFHYHIDSEGMLKKDLTLIENGILKSFYHNTATAKYFSTASTGHASRDPRSSLNVTGTNLIIKAGKHSDSEVHDDTYLEIIDLMGLHSGGDPISGEFSFGASGYLCKNGKRLQPVKGITVAGNFNKLICGISRIGAELKHNNSRTLFGPLIRFSNLAVAGK